MNKNEKKKINDKFSQDIENNEKKKNKKDEDNIVIELPDWNLEPPVDDKNERGEA